MKRAETVAALAAVAAGVYGGYGMVSGTGLAGWFNYLQQSVFGSYSMKLTMLLLIVAVLGVWLAALFLASAVFKDDGGVSAAALVQKMAAPHDRPLTSRSLVMLTLGTLLLIWIGGYAMLWWNNRIDREDTRAQYQGLDLADPAAATAPLGSHVALKGQLLRQRTVVSQHGSGSTARPEYHLLPMVGPGWQEGQPARFVVKVKQLADLSPGGHAGALPLWRPPGQAAPAPRGEPPVLGRLEGALPVPAVQEFRKMGVPLSDDAQIVRWVPSKDGAPDVKDESEANFQIYLWIAGGLSVLFTLAYAFVGWSMLRRDRKAAAAAPAYR